MFLVADGENFTAVRISTKIDHVVDTRVPMIRPFKDRTLVFIRIISGFFKASERFSQGRKQGNRQGKAH